MPFKNSALRRAKKTEPHLGLCFYLRSRESLLAAQCVLDAADGVLHLAFYLVALALGFQLGIAQYLASNFLRSTLGLFSRALDAVFVHASLHTSPFHFEDKRSEFHAESTRPNGQSGWAGTMCRSSSSVKKCKNSSEGARPTQLAITYRTSVQIGRAS